MQFQSIVAMAFAAIVAAAPAPNGSPAPANCSQSQFQACCDQSNSPLSILGLNCVVSGKSPITDRGLFSPTSICICWSGVTAVANCALTTQAQACCTAQNVSCRSLALFPPPAAVIVASPIYFQILTVRIRASSIWTPVNSSLFNPTTISKIILQHPAQCLSKCDIAMSLRQAGTEDGIHFERCLQRLGSDFLRDVLCLKSSYIRVGGSWVGQLDPQYIITHFFFRSTVTINELGNGLSFSSLSNNVIFTQLCLTRCMIMGSWVGNDY